MAELAAELALRNARLRAWRVYGVPVLGGWTVFGPERGALLELRCGPCNRAVNGFLEGLFVHSCFDLPWALRSTERVKTLELGCPQLAPLLGEDPREVLELTKLELLAGP